MMNDLRSLREEYMRRLARREVLQENREKLAVKLEEVRQSVAHHAEAIPVLMKLAQVWRSQELSDVNGLATAALRAVFEQPYEFRFREEEKRGQVELTPVVIEDGEEYEPRDSMGGGITDVLSLSFRPIFWSKMGEKRSEPTIVLDEPGQNVNSEEFIRNLSKMIKRLSEELGLQFLIVTSRTSRAALASHSDRAFFVEKKGRTSQVNVLGQ